MGLFSVTLVASDNSANSTTVSLNPNLVQSIAPPTAGEIVAFPTAQSAIVYQEEIQNQKRTRRFLTTSTVAAANSALSAAQAGALGSGASGQTTLVAGTKAITITGLTANSNVIGSLTTNANDSATVKYRFTPSANTLTITALVAAGTINVADTSVVTYAIVG